MLSPSEDGSPSSGTGSLLKDQVAELTNRMRYLETLLHDPHRHRDSRDHLQRPHSFSSARGGVVAVATRTAARGRQQRDGAKGGYGSGSSSNNKRASQDDWANNLSKRSWPPPTGGAVDSRRSSAAALQSHSCGGGSSGSLLSPVAVNRVSRWQGLTPTQANRRRRNNNGSGGGGKGATGRSSGGRVVARDNPPGIVLI